MKEPKNFTKTDTGNQWSEWYRELSVQGIENPRFFSQYENIRVFDNKGVLLGKLKDMAIRSGEAMLEVSSIVYSTNILGEKVIMPMENVGSFNESIKLNIAKEAIPPGRLSENEMLMTETILDKQIVDIDGLKVVRVNDVMLARVKGVLSVIGVDVGFKGILRRLWAPSVTEKLFAKLPNQIIPWSYIDPLDPELRKIHLNISRKNIQDLHPADIADILEELDNKERLLILESLDDETAAEALGEIEPDVQDTVINNMESENVADLLENMNPDDAADILSRMPEERATEVLEKMDAEDASDVKELMEYSENSAGGIMTNMFLSVPSGTKISDVFTIIRVSCHDIDMIYYVYVLNSEEHLIGVLSIRDLLLAGSDQIIDDVMETEVLSVLPSSSTEEVANLLSKYDFLALPVVDEAGVMLGIITFDDALDYIIPEDVKKHLPKNYPKSRRMH